MTAAPEGSLWESNLGDFRDKTASASPTPGGGSVAAVSAALGMGLVVMALEISGSRKDVRDLDAIQALIQRGRDSMGLLSRAADNDVAAFQGFMAALKLPKQSDDEKRARKAAMAEASHAATLAPLAAAKHILDALGIADAAIPLTHSHVLSDVGAGTSLLGGALTAILFNVDINLPSIADDALKSELAAERNRLASRGADAVQSILARVSASL